MSIFIKLLLVRCSNKGFTLIELIAASIMTLFIVSAAGFGMIVMLREQTIATAGGDIQYNLNRAADFISEEVRQASSITTTAVWPTGSSTSCSSSGPSGTTRTFVLGLTIPPGTSTNVIYFTNTPPGSPWIGNSAIFRCGPAYRGNGGIVDDNGTPSNVSDDIQIFSNGYNKTTDALVDLIASPSGLTTSPCPTGFNAPSPSVTNGFFVCVNTVNPSLIQLNLFASAQGDKAVQTITGNNPDQTTRYGDKATYSVSTLVYSRSKPAIPLDSSTTSGGTFSSPSSSANATFVTSGCTTTSPNFFPIDIAGTTTNITTNGTMSVIITGSSLDVNPPSGITDFTFVASTNGGTFTRNSCVVTATLTTP